MSFSGGKNGDGGDGGVPVRSTPQKVAPLRMSTTAGDNKSATVGAGAGAGAGAAESKRDTTPKDEPTKETTTTAATAAAGETKKKRWTPETAQFALDAQFRELRDDNKTANAAHLLGFIRDLAGSERYRDVSMVWYKQKKTEYAVLGTRAGFAANWHLHLRPQAAADVKAALVSIDFSQHDLLDLVIDERTHTNLVRLTTLLSIPTKPGLSTQAGTRASTAAAFGEILQLKAWFKQLKKKRSV